MIEENILELIDLGDAIQKIDVYTNKKYLFFYHYHYLILKHAKYNAEIFCVFIFIYFAQIWCLNIIHVNIEGDFILEIIKYIEKVFLLNKIIIDNITYEIIELIFIFISVYALIIGLISICLLFFMKSIRFFYISTAIIYLSLNYYLIGPSIEFLLLPILCKNKANILPEEKCFNYSAGRYSFFIIGIIYAVFIIFVSYFIALYMNEIGSIGNINEKNRINCNYSLVATISKIIMYLLSFYFEFFISDKNLFIKIIYQIYLFINCFVITIYVSKKLYYYNNLINNFFHYGWYFSTWFSLCIFLKTVLKIKDISMFIIIGIVLIYFCSYFSRKVSTVKLITEFNILEGNTLKNIEKFISLLLNLIREKDQNSKILVAGVIKRFEEYIADVPELNDQYKKLLNDKHLKNKFTSYNELNILSIIYVVYNHNLEKSNDKIDITLNMCYFLVNHFKNPIFAMLLCSKLKTKTNQQLYYKYILCEQIKEYLINKLNKNTRNNSIRHIQISSSILYYQYVDLFKIKIYDAACNQIEYFDHLKNSVTTSKTTENFLRIGEDILRLRKEILSLWEKLVQLNPFCYESEKDFILYLDSILQDDLLLRTEEKKYNEIKINKLPEKNNTYYSLFEQEISSVLLIDGHSNYGKIIYSTPNFPSLFSFNGKEILNATVDELLPFVLQNFHKYLIEDAVKYSNLQYIFKNKRDVLLKGKNGGIFNVYLYVKTIPKLSFGIIYFSYIQKMKEQNFIIVLDEDYKINGFTEMGVLSGSENGYTLNLNNNYQISHSLIGHHIAEIIPEILLQMNYDIKKNIFTTNKNNIDIKGYLYPIHHGSNIDNQIIKLLSLIKEKNNKKEFMEEYETLIKELNRKTASPYSIFYRLELHSFMGGKYKYCRLYITNDLLSANDNLLKIQSNVIKSNYNLDDDNNLNKNSTINDAENNYLPKNENLNFFNYDTKVVKDVSLNDIGENNEEKKNKSSEHVANSLFKREKNKELKEKGINLINNDENNNNNNKIIQNSNLVEKNEENPQNTAFNNDNKESSSILTQSSMYSNEFNKLKTEIINKQDFFYMKLMKCLSIVYIIIIICLIVYETLSNRFVLLNLISFLHENLFFTRSKIDTACIYISGVNLKWMKDGKIKEDNCESSNCTTFYSNLMIQCIKDIEVRKENLSTFYNDYQNIIKQKSVLNLSIYQRNINDTLNLDLDNYLNLIISNGVKVLANLDTILAPEQDIIDYNLYNLIELSLNHFYSNYSGFFGQDKINKANAVSVNRPIRIIICIAMLFALFCIFFYIIFKFNNLENYLLDKLINFNSNNFEIYLTKLSELKKKFRDDTNEENDKNLEDIEINDMELNSKLRGENAKKIDNEEKNQNNTEKNKEIEQNKNNDASRKKKGKSKQNKLQQQKMKKKQIMSEYFFKWNCLYAITIFIILVASVTYFLISSIRLSILRKQYHNFDGIMASIGNVFYQSFNICLVLKTELKKFEEENETYIMKIPKSIEIDSPKLGNLLMEVTGNKNLNQKYVRMVNTLYTGDSCIILFDRDKNGEEICQKFWNSILRKGIEQAIVQMNVIISSSLDELNSLNDRLVNFKEFLRKGSSYANYETFVEYYLYLTFEQSINIFSVFILNRSLYMSSSLMTIQKIYYFIYPVLFLILILVIISYKKGYNSFLNFIGILPSKYITDDENLYKKIICLEQEFY